MTTFRPSQNVNPDSFEHQTWQKGALACGIDEVGRGCIAGPLVAAAAILLPNKKSDLIKDSKILTQIELQKAFRWLQKHAWFSYAIINHRAIDKHNIYNATHYAMKRAALQLLLKTPQPQTILVDAIPMGLDNTGYEHIDVFYFPHGERKSSSIAAASIIAKTIRDNLMRRFDVLFPAYQFAQHKGYGTAIHQQALQHHGPSLIHRMHFITEKSWLAGRAEKKQQRSLLDTA